MQLSMAKKSVLVTGGSSGIGRAIAALFREAGAEVAITGRRKEPLLEAAEAIGAVAVPGDVCDPAHAAEAVRTCAERFGGLTTLVNNAGVIGGGSTESTAVTEWDRILEINLRGTMLVTKAAIPLLKRAQGASVLNLSSVAGNRPYAAVTAYCVSKAAVEMFTRCLALELAPAKVRVNAIAPGVVVTNLHTASNAVPDYPAFLERSKETHPLGFVGQPEDAARLALFLCSDAARWITGGVFPLDGGRALASAR
jgi:NAD(P)-dependent dehydrogenase (short-subunit alcohol dehydrogenase family)